MVKNKPLRIAIILCNLLLPLVAQPLKVLHLSFHKGCIKDFEYVAKQLNLEVTSLFVQAQEPKWLDGETIGNNIYNIGHDRAEKAWLKNKDFFDQFDVVVTSDTAPLARIFLQNGWKKPLIIWVCNRFDYHDGSQPDCLFPDPEYYELFRKAHLQSNVKIISYTPFEHYYAKLKGVNIGNFTIKPCARPDNQCKASSIPPHIQKDKTFFIPPYLNDTHYMNVAQICNNMGIPAYAGRYNGPGDLKDFKGIIHLPYAWSNLALFENIQNGVPYFIPSKKFILQLAKRGNYFFMMLNRQTIKYSEWYAEENKELFTYFDSWKDLKEKIKKTDFPKLKTKITQFAQRHHDTMLNRWQTTFTTLTAQ